MAVPGLNLQGVSNKQQIRIPHIGQGRMQSIGWDCQSTNTTQIQPQLVTI